MKDMDPKHALWIIIGAFALWALVFMYACVQVWQDLP